MSAKPYKRPASPFWYIHYFCTKRLKRVHEATVWRHADPTGIKHATRFLAEKNSAANEFRGVAKFELWGAWVEKFLRDRYRTSPLTLTRYLNAWDWLVVYLDEKKIHVPAALDYNTVLAYIDWRTGQKRHSGKCVSRNTAITEIKVLGVIMREAMRRGFASANPCERLNIQRDPAKEKPELTEAEIALIRDECIRREATLALPEQWMTTCFEIALHTLCRLRSTEVPMHLVNFERDEITLRVKGRRNGEPRWLTVPIHPDLRPRLQALRDAGASHTCRLPRMAAKEWWALRQKLGIAHTCFHSTRVTGITRLWRAGVGESFAMRLAGHNSPTVHRIYQRGSTADLRASLNQLRFSASSDKPATPQNPDAAQPSDRASVSS